MCDADPDFVEFMRGDYPLYIKGEFLIGRVWSVSNIVSPEYLDTLRSIRDIINALQII